MFELLELAVAPVRKLASGSRVQALLMGKAGCLHEVVINVKFRSEVGTAAAQRGADAAADLGNLDAVRQPGAVELVFS